MRINRIELESNVYNNNKFNDDDEEEIKLFLFITKILREWAVSNGSIEHNCLFLLPEKNV